MYYQCDECETNQDYVSIHECNVSLILSWKNKEDIQNNSLIISANQKEDNWKSHLMTPSHATASLDSIIALIKLAEMQTQHPHVTKEQQTLRA